MDPAVVALALGGGLVVLLACGIWIGLALMAVGLIALEGFTSIDAGLSLGTTLWGATNSWTLTALPMFIWMGEILARSRLAEDMFRGIAPWVQGIPGRLLHVNVFGCGIFAAISGSSAATAATIGRMTIPELRKRGYGDFMLVGSLSGSGTLGLLIPPSLTMIVYGVAAEVSIARLFVAGVIPGLILMGLFSAVVAVWALLNPNDIPPRDPKIPLMAKLKESILLIPVVLLIIAVIASIYLGIATPTEAAVVGVAGALLLSGLSGGLTWQNFLEGVAGAVRTNCMIGIILAGAAFLSTAMGFTQLPLHFAEWIKTFNLSPTMLIAVLTVVYIFLGCFLDGISMVLLTAAIILPTVQAAGIDLLWFGIFIVLVVEMSQITPPVGLNLFVLQGMARRSLGYVALASVPFFLMLNAMVVLITMFPDIVMWLPDQMFTRR